MAGIYVHIPFCTQLCNYCDFHFSVSLKNKDQLMQALINEIELQKDYLNGNTMETIYFGGGTPSILSQDEINNIINKIYSIHQITDNPEITFEANPDDLTKNYLLQLKNTPITRLSIGIQSFFNTDLQFLNRRHNAIDTINCIQNSQEVGFDNINIDLIYGIPGMGNTKWKSNLHKAFKLNIQHISAYHLSFEPKTVFSYYLKKGKIKPIDEKDSVEQFKTLTRYMKKEGFIHYEISNFAKDGFFSKHNLNYWFQKKYLGIGPSAHSYNGLSRQWNVANNTRYIRALENNEQVFERETLNNLTKYNDYVLTSLRTMWGIDLKYLQDNFGMNARNHCLKAAKKKLNNKYILLANDKIFLSEKGKLIADNIISELFMIE